MLPDHKDVPIPRFLTRGLDGSGKSQLVYLPTNRETSGSNSVSNEGNETSVTDHEYQYSNERSILDKTLIGNGSYLQTSMSPMEPKYAMSDHQDESLSSRSITTQNNEIWFSKSTQQADNHPRIDKVFSQAVGLPIEEKRSSISTHREVPFTSIASNEITGQKNETWGSKPTDSVSNHPRVDKASSQIVKTPVAVRTSSISAHRNASFGSMASEDITTQEDEVPVKQVQNGEFYGTSYSADKTRTTVPSVSESSIQIAKIKSQFPSPKPDITRSAPQIRKDESSSLKDNLQTATFSNSSSMELFLTINEPERPAPDRGPFSIQRLLSSHKPSKETQVTNVPSSIPSPQKGNVNMPKNPTGVSSGAASSLKAGFRRDKDLVRPSSKYDPESIQILDNTNGLVEVTNASSSLPSRQDVVQSLSPSGKSSSYTSSRDSMVGRHISHSSTVSPNGPSEQGKSGIHPAPLQTTSSNISPAFPKHHKPSQNAMSSKLKCKNAIPPKESSVVNTHTNTWIRQDPNDAREPNSQLHFQSSVLKLPCDTTSQKRNLPVPVATVQAMRSYSNSFKVISSVSSTEQLNRSRNDSGSPHVHNSNESKRNTQQWRHKDPKIQAKRKQHDTDTFHLPVATASLNTSSKNSDLQTFVSYLTEAEIPNARSVVEKQTFEASFNIRQESLLESLLTSKTVLTIQPGDNRKSVDQSRMGMHNNTDFYLGATERESRPRYDDKILQSQSYFTNADIQYRTKGTIPSGAHYNPQNRLHFEHCPMRQVTQYKNPQSHPHHRKQREKSTYKQH